MNDFAESTIRLLYAQRWSLSPSRRVRRHSHPYWQCELLFSGQASLLLDEGPRAVPTGRPVFIAPRVVHGFHYTAPTTDFISLKFAMESGPPGVTELADSACCRALLPLFDALVDVGAEADPTRATAITGALTTALAWLARDHDSQHSDGDGPLLPRLSALIRNAPQRPWTVATAAATLGLSSGHASARFRAESGISLKAWLDRQRADQVLRYLRWSDLPVTTIAAECGFPDVATCSRFLKRVTGRSPRNWRALRESGAGVDEAFEAIEHPPGHQSEFRM